MVYIIFKKDIIMSKKIEEGTIYKPTGEKISRNPRDNQLSILRNCKVCNKQFYANLGNIRKGMGETCSISCAHINKGNKKSVVCVCNNCGKEFKTQACRVSNGRGKYCSKQCSYEGRRKEKIPLVCEFCGKTFYRQPYKKRQLETGYVKNIFCSQRCSHDSRMTGEVVKCEHCGKEFYKQRGQIRRCCSWECHNKIYFGKNHHRYNPNKIHREGEEFTPRQRKVIFDKYDWKCAATDTSVDEGEIHLHHIVPISEGGKGVVSNGIPLRDDIHPVFAKETHCFSHGRNWQPFLLFCY
jgi:hypothetical protein